MDEIAAVRGDPRVPESVRAGTDAEILVYIEREAAMTARLAADAVARRAAVRIECRGCGSRDRPLGRSGLCEQCRDDDE